MSDTPDKTATVGIFIFNRVEVLDFCGPFEVFSVAERPGEDGGEPRLFRALTIAETSDIVRTTGGLLVQPHHTLDDHPPLDIVVIPGGHGTERERENPAVLDWIRRQQAADALLTSVCTGSFLLASAGLLDDRRATTHWGSIGLLRERHAAVQVLEDARVVNEGRIITSAGVSSGIDMALHVIEQLHGLETARWTARLMEYNWAEIPVV